MQHTFHCKIPFVLLTTVAAPHAYRTTGTRRGHLLQLFPAGGAVVPAERASVAGGSLRSEPPEPGLETNPLTWPWAGTWRLMGDWDHSHLYRNGATGPLGGGSSLSCETCHTTSGSCRNLKWFVIWHPGILQCGKHYETIGNGWVGGLSSGCPGRQTAGD